MEDKNKVITVIDVNKEIIYEDGCTQSNESIRPKFIKKKYPANYSAVDPEAVISCSNCQNDCKQPLGADVIVCPQYNEKSGGRKKEPDYLKKQSSRLEKILGKHSTVIIFGVEIDTRKIKNKAYFVKKAYQIISNPDRPTDSDSFQLRTNIVRCLEYMLKAQFKNTRDFKEKCKNFLARTKAKEGTKNITRSAGKRIIRARKKLKWTQERLAEESGFRSRKTIQRYENDLMYPPVKVINWLKEVEKQ